MSEGDARLTMGEEGCALRASHISPDLNCPRLVLDGDRRWRLNLPQKACQSMDKCTTWHIWKNWQASQSPCLDSTKDTKLDLQP